MTYHSYRKTNGDSSLAVDGFESKCMTIDNYFVEKPIWMVDLVRRIRIGGLILRIGTENNQTIHRDYFNSLDRFNIYVSNHSYQIDFHQRQFCSSLTRIELSSSRLHIQCQTPLNGRFVYIQSTGISNQWNRYFTVALCEISVYEE